MDESRLDDARRHLPASVTAKNRQQGARSVLPSDANDACGWRRDSKRAWRKFCTIGTGAAKFVVAIMKLSMNSPGGTACNIEFV
jgi:hypothetical protein